MVDRFKIVNGSLIPYNNFSWTYTVVLFKIKIKLVYYYEKTLNNKNTYQ